MTIFFEFLTRLGCGMTAAMAVTSARHVSSGFFRNHLYVVLGILTLACLAAASVNQTLLWGTVPAAALAYAGAVAWLYEARRAGKIILWLLAMGTFALAIAGAQVARPSAAERSAAASALRTPNQTGTGSDRMEVPVPVLLGPLNMLDVATASWLLGMVMMSMLLGHWYLNAPEMEIQPLSKMLRFTFAGLLARALVCGGGLVWGLRHVAELPQTVAWLLVLRWLCGFAGLAGALGMAWQTLKIPNTQSATGLLYVAVFAVLAGEIVSLLLSAQYAFVL